jgi:hypothetical protein
MPDVRTVYNLEVGDFHTYFVGTAQLWVHNACSCGGSSAAGGGGGRGANHLKPDPSAQGAHSTFKMDPTTGRVTGHAEWQPNPRNPSCFDQAKRVDVTGAPHYNKVTGERVPTPHTHGKDIPGGVRPATPDEVPR